MSEVYCFKCKKPLDVIDEDLYDDDEKEMLYERELSKGRCPKCGQIAYFTVEWMFEVSI